MKLKRLMALGMAAVMTMSLTACGGNSNDDTTTNNNTSNNDTATSNTDNNSTASSDNTAGADSAVPTYASIKLGEDYTDLTASIKFIHHKTDREGDGTMANLIAEFNKVYPNITVETEGITDYAGTSLLRLPTGADWGDIMFIPTIDVADYPEYFQPYGTVEEMSELINFADNCKLDDYCYGIGYMGNAQGLLYNKKVFADAGITELPKTPDEFIAALQLIKDNTDAIPLYTNYASGWALGGQWDALLGAITTGDTAWLNQKFTHQAEPFADNGDGTGAYALYKILYDAVAQGLTEEDYTTTDWEGCKGMINNGKIGCMALGSWAVVQMQEAGPNGADIGYMPFPVSVNGKQYASAGPDYCYGINCNSSADNQIAAMCYVKWLVEESGFAQSQGGISIVTGDAYPDALADFEGIELVVNAPAAEGEENLWNDVNNGSELGITVSGAIPKEIVEAAVSGTKTMEEMAADWNEKWTAAQEASGITH